MENLTLKFILQHNQLSDGLYQVALRIIKGREKKEIGLNMRCKREEFVNEKFIRSYPNSRATNQLLLKFKLRADEIIRQYQLDEYNFTLEEFSLKFRGISQTKDLNAISFFDEIIGEYLKSGRIGNARAYDETKNALVRFAGKNVPLKTVDPQFLEKFEVFLRENNNTDGGIAFKMREFRALFNKAINRNLISQDVYPFKFYKISKLKPLNNKRALSEGELKRIKDVDLSDRPDLIDAYNYFIFSFYVRGINFVDMTKLKWSDIQEGRIHYVRSKTKGQFNIQIMEPAQAILDFYKKQNRPSDYVFPILLKDDLTPVQIAYRKKKVLQRCNSRLKEIAALAGVKTNLTSYVARHTFATTLKRKGASTDAISELMGHSNVQVTMTYLKEFDNDVLDKENQKLLDL